MDIRDARADDLPGILAIYNDVVATSTAIYRDEPATLDAHTDWWRQRVAAGYPVLVADPDAAYPAGHALILSGGGKRGTQGLTAPFVGQRVQIKGALVKRGDIDMVLVNEVTPAPGPVVPPTVTPLGTWRVVGEICDGTCVSGVMRPGDGLAHKACANVCILGGVPPLLVLTGPVAGHKFMLMGDLSGQALPDSFRDHVGVPRRMEGTVERVADLLIFRTDVTKATVP